MAQRSSGTVFDLRAIPAADPPDPNCTLCWYAAHPEGGIPPMDKDGCCPSHCIWTATGHQHMPPTQFEGRVRWTRYVAGGVP